jgi:isopropylmalate/homocitrate/citramalate synthase
MAPAVTICDVGPRDGLQNDPACLAPAVRAELCRRLAASGLARVEAASFVDPRLVPQMDGAEGVFDGLRGESATSYAALVLNERGLERAREAGGQAIHMSYAVTDSFGLRNQNADAEQGAALAARIVSASHAAGLRASITLSVSFGCPFEGDVDPGVVLDHVARLADAGADEVLLADTIGVGVPSQVRRLAPDALAALDGRPLGLHLHDTRNTALANADAGLACGVTLFDASVGGLGGCPFAPHATGNVATEDLVFMLERMGIETGIDLDALIEVAHWLAGVLGHELPGMVQRAGPFRAGGAGER